MAMLGIVPGEDVEAQGPGKVGDVEVAEMVGAGGRDVVEERLGGGTQRVDQAHALAALDVLDEHPGEQGGFAAAGFSLDVEMAAAIGTGKAKRVAERVTVADPPADDGKVVVAHSPKATYPATRFGRNVPGFPAGSASVAFRGERAVLPDPRSRRGATAGGWLCAGTSIGCL